MAKRRPHGTGSLIERPKGSGRWFYRYSAGPDPVTGRPQRRAVTLTAKTKTEAEKEARRILASREDAPNDSTATLSQLLSEWMRFQEDRGRSPTTLNGYRSLIATHIEPALGGIKIGKLSVYHLDSLYTSLTKDGKSPRTIRNVHNVISAALNQAIRWDWITQNVSARTTLPRATSKPLDIPSPEDVQRLISLCQSRNEVVGAFVFLAAVTGCRRGEVAAIRWSSLRGPTLTIEASAYSSSGHVGVKSTKTGRSRQIHLADEVVEWLKAWRDSRRKLAIDWGVRLDTDSFIFSGVPDGSRPISLDLVSREVRRAADALALPGIHLHSLRHLAATELLAAGVSARDTADFLGHADPALTLRTYAHPTLDRQRAASEVLSRSLKAPSPTEAEA